MKAASSSGVASGEAYSTPTFPHGCFSFVRRWKTSAMPIVAKNMSVVMKLSGIWLARTNIDRRAVCSGVAAPPGRASPKHAVTEGATNAPPGDVAFSLNVSGCARRKSVHSRLSPSSIGVGGSGPPHVSPSGQSASSRHRLVPSEHRRHSKLAPGTSRQR